MPQDPILEEIRQIRASQKRMEQAVLGDSEIGVTGLVKRVGSVEGKVNIMQKERIKLVGMVTGAGFVVSLLVSYVFGR
jgi:hypothetical protein